MRHSRLAAVFFAALTAAALGCAHQVPTRPDGVEGLSAAEYGGVVRAYTVQVNKYSGFYQTFQADMTILSTEMQTAALKQRANFQQWDQKHYLAEREKMLQDASAYSKFFMRFFSPEHDYDDLQKDKSIWKIYLDYNGQRFEGKVKKLKEKFVELATIYPYFDRFSTAYEITFNVPMSTVENGPCKVTLTSSLGTAEFSFPGKK
jgi:hypothetical protein